MAVAPRITIFLVCWLWPYEKTIIFSVWLQELERKLAKLAKAMDHLERARREEEAPLVAQAAQRRIVSGWEMRAGKDKLERQIIGVAGSWL
jgi:hypothetical protein